MHSAPRRTSPSPAGILIAAALFVLFASTAGTREARAQATYDEIQIQINEPQPRIKIPGLEFSSREEIERATRRESDGNTYLFIPYIGEYIAAAYKYLILLFGLESVILLIIHGFGIVQMKGDREKLERAKTRIGHAFQGLLIAVGSYVILYTINPELVEFKSLKILYIPTEINDVEGEPDAFTATQQGLKVSAAPLNAATCKLELFPTYAQKQTDFGSGNGLCLQWVKRALSNSCGALPADLDAAGAWDAAATFVAQGKFHPCNLDGIKNGDIVFMTSIGSNWIGLWENFRTGPQGCTIADPAKKPTRMLKNGEIAGASPIKNGQTMPPVTHIGVYYNGTIYHRIKNIAADQTSKITQFEDRGLPKGKNKKNWTEPDEIELTGNFVAAEFIAGYGYWEEVSR